MRRILFCAFALLMLSGCIELEEKFTIRPDGSGTYRSRQVFSKEMTSMIQSAIKQGNLKADLPVSRKDLERRFSGPGVRIVSSSFEVVRERLTGEFEIAFEDASTFFRLPGMSKRFYLYRDDGRLYLKSIPKENMAPGKTRFATARRIGAAGEDSEKIKEMQKAMMESMKTFLKGLKISVTIELPNKILDANTTRVRGRSASWLIDQDTLMDPEKLANMGDHLFASCSMKGVSFKPPTLDQLAGSLASANEKARTASTAMVKKGAGALLTKTATVSTVHPEKPPVSKAAKTGPDAGWRNRTLGKKCIVYLKNGNRLKADGFHRENDKFTFRKFGGSFSLPVSEIAEIKDYPETASTH